MPRLMKNLPIGWILWLLLAWLLIVSPALIGQTFDPYQDFSANDFDKHHPPPVPEPSTYGFIMVGSAIVFVGAYEYFKRKSLRKDQSL